MFRRIPRLSKKRALLITLVVVAVAVAIPLVGWQQPDEESIRFRLWDYWDAGYVSLDETKIADLFHLDLSAYQFPDDYPLTVERGQVLLKLKVGGEQVRVRVILALSDHCTPSPDLRSLLCGIPFDPSGYDANPERDGLMDALDEYIYSRRLFFIVTPGISQIYVIPEDECRECNFIAKTYCQWATTSQIYCTTSLGTTVSEVTLFDLHSGSFVDLPHDGANIETNTHFSKGRIYEEHIGFLENVGYIDGLRPPHRFEVYSLDNTLAYQSVIEDWTADQDTVTTVAYCGDKSLCINKLEFDDRGLTSTRQAVLGELRSEDTTNKAITLHEVLQSLWTRYMTSCISEIPEEYLVSAYGRVYIVSKATLEVKRVLDYPESKSAAGWNIALFKREELLITGSYPFDNQIDGGTTAHDLSKCQARLDDSCKLHVWNSVERPVDEQTSGYYVWRHIYYSPGDQPDYIFSIDEDTSRLTIHNLKDWTDYDFEMTGVPRLVTTSTDSRFLLVATAPDHDTPLKDAEYHLFDLRTMQPVERELLIGKNLFLVRRGI